jgi:prepilin-type N-terminal cleavage/methylation domain-containing protein
MKYQQLRKKAEGFTIIEVLIVLAIAGLILLIVFLAVPQLQRNQRNNARTADASRISAAITECLANRNGVTTACDANPSTETNVQPGSLSQVTTFGNGAASTTNARIQFGRVCTADASNNTATGATARSFTVLYQLEPSVQRCIGSE